MEKSIKKYLALKASAGSGKTFALTVRYISLMLLGAKPNEILALTFTNKAANEMSQRIFKTLNELGSDEVYLEQISKQVNMSPEEIISRKTFLVNQYLNSELSIYTIDKFVNKILREFSGYLGINDDFEIKEDNVENLSYKFLQDLDEKDFSKLIEFASYESKKVNSIFDLFVNLYEKNEEFTVVDIEAKLINLQKQQALNIAYKLKEHILNCEVASASAKKAVAFDSFEELLVRGKTWMAKEVSTDARDFKKCSNEEFERNFQELKVEMANYYKIRASYSLSSIYKLFLAFKNYKKKYNQNKNYFTFNDISNYTNELLNEKIDKEFLYFRLDSSYNHILIDEFQDTSLLQYKILKPLIEESISGDSEKFKTFFYVGDTKQSIYRFRGGKRELFDFVNENFEQVEVEVLNVNYRSSKNLIDFVNNSFSNLPSYEYYDQESVIKDGFVEVFVDENLVEDEKFLEVTNKIGELINEGVDANSIAVLTYTNNDVLELYSYLQEKMPKLKVTTEMTSKLINQENVKACINAIKYLYYGEKIYLENLNAILGNEVGTPLKFDFDLHENKVFELIKKVALFLNILDDNIIKLIEECSKFATVVDFIYEIDDLEASMPNKEQTGLQILTIFKSKGLEFDTVILLDRLKNKNHDRSSLLFDYSSVNLQNVYYKISNLENFDENYKIALEKEKALQYIDEVNILYVALTRAKNNLIIFKKEAKSAFDTLGLGVMKLGTLKIQKKNEQIVEVVEKIDYKPMNLGRQNSKALINDQEEFDLTTRYFGIATHYCLEMMNEFTKEELDFAIELSKSRYSNFLKDEVFCQIKDRILKLIENEQFKTLVTNSEFSTEQSLLYNDELKIIDLLIFKDDAYYIIDYKTTMSEKEEHKSQVSFYKKAIKEIMSCDEVYAYLAYLKEDRAFLVEV